MSDFLKMKDEGFETVRLVDEAGNVLHETTIDLWETYSRIGELQAKYKGKPDHEYYAALIDYLVEQGFPKVSHRFAFHFNNNVVSRVAELKNALAGVPSQGSPVSTASTPSS